MILANTLLGFASGKMSKHIPQMVVKNGDASHGRIRKKSEIKQTKNDL